MLFYYFYQETLERRTCFVGMQGSTRSLIDSPPCQEILEIKSLILWTVVNIYMV